MKITKEQKMNAWVAFAAGALAGIANLDGDSEVNNECEVAAEYADWMLDNFEKTFRDDDDE